MLEYWKKDKIGWEGSKMQNVEIWQYIFLLMRALLTKKYKLRKKSLKLDVYGLN
jgi:hypothetical protein